MEVIQLPLDIDQLCRPRRRASLNLRPSYQRTHEGVWSKQKKQLLIDTILRGYDMPKLYWREVDAAPYTHEVVDGQQRMRAIFEFFDGQFELGDESVDLTLGDLSGLRYDELGTEAQDVFGSFSLSVYRLVGWGDEEIRDLFLRLQEGSTLNPAEKRNAMMGSLRDFLAGKAGQDGTPHAVFPLTNIQSTRNAWDDLAAHAMKLAIADGPADLSAASLKRMYEAERNFAHTGPVAKRFLRTLNLMARVLKSSPPEMDIKWGFVDLFLALWVMDQEYALAGLDAELADSFIEFERERRSAISSDVADLLGSGRDEWDRDLYDYIQAFQREGNKKSNVSVRHEVYLRRLLRDVRPVAKDPRRLFTSVERMVLWREAGGRCQNANCGIQLAFDECVADHVDLHSAGGKTELANGQCLCVPCNSSKNHARAVSSRASHRKSQGKKAVTKGAAGKLQASKESAVKGGSMPKARGRRRK